MVGLQIIVRTTEGKRREFVQAFGMLTRPESRNTACLCQELYEEADRSNRFLWLEYWSDMRSLRDYLGSTRFRTVLGAIDVVGSRDDIKITEIHEHAEGAAGGEMKRT